MDLSTRLRTEIPSRNLHENRSLRLDIFENPYGGPRPTESENPPSNKTEIPKILKSSRIPKSKRYFPQSKRYIPQRKNFTPKVNVKYSFGSFLRNLKILNRGFENI